MSVLYDLVSFLQRGHSTKFQKKVQGPENCEISCLYLLPNFHILLFSTVEVDFEK